MFCWFSFSLFLKLLAHTHNLTFLHSAITSLQVQPWFAHSPVLLCSSVLLLHFSPSFSSVMAHHPCISLVSTHPGKQHVSSVEHCVNVTGLYKYFETTPLGGKTEESFPPAKFNKVILQTIWREFVWNYILIIYPKFIPRTLVLVKEFNSSGSPWFHSFWQKNHPSLFFIHPSRSEHNHGLTSTL